MAIYSKLNPYQEIMEKIDLFFKKNYAAIETLMKRQDPVSKGMIRLMDLSFLVNNDSNIAIGIINVNIMNDKYDIKNLCTNQWKKRHNVDIDANYDVNPEYFQQDFLDPVDRFKVRINITQFESEAMGKSPVKVSSQYTINQLDANKEDIAIKSKEMLGYLWDDPSIVLVTKKYFNRVIPLLDTWVPSVTDITTQTLFHK